MPDKLSELVRNGVLRAAINTGNRALVQQQGGDLRGVSPALARRLAAELAARLEPVIYDGAGKVFDDAGNDLWDIAFLAIDQIRAKKVTFSRPYHRIEATYAVRSSSPIQTPDEADRDGITVLASKGSAYELYLTRALRKAKLECSATPGESFDVFRAGKGEVVAGIRASLERAFGGDPDYRVLPGVLTSVEQAMVLPRPNDPRRAELDAFVARAIDSGFVAREMT